MIEHLLRFTFPAAYSLLPPALESRAATVLVLAIAIQRTGLSDRRQRGGGPARSFWLFDRGETLRIGATGGLAAVLAHPSSGPMLLKVLAALQYPVAPIQEVLRVLMLATEHNDVLAAACALAALQTLTVPLAVAGDAAGAYRNYAEVWQPGRMLSTDWEANYDAALTAVTALSVVRDA